MTIKECIDIVDNAKPNQYTIKEKVMWLSFVDETIINDVLKTHEGYDGRYDDFTGYTEDKLSVPLIVPSPYDRLYPQYIKMMIDSENGETARYNNSAALYNTYLTEYKKWYNKTHMPLNATQKIPSPVSININSHLSDAQIEYIKRQLYYMLSQDVDEVISHDKLYDIAMEYYQNNTEVLKGKDGKDGEKGEKGDKGDKGEPGKDGDAPDGVMSYAGKVEALPDEARAGELYKLIKYKLIVTRLWRSTNGLSIGEYAENQAGAFELCYEEDSVISKYLQACINKDVKIQIDDTVLTVSVWNASNAYALLGNYNAPEIPAFSDYITYWCEDVPCDNDEYASDWVVDGYSDEPDTFRYVLYNGTEFEVLSDITQISGLEKQLGEKSDKGHEHSAGDISTGTLSVSRGGTGKSSFSANRIIYPSSSSYLSQLAFPSKESVLAQKSSGAPYWKPISELSGGFKKIGFTNDCDYIVASASSALSVFRTAIAEASDGDTILIMPGTYGAGDNTGKLEISKNLNFVGIRMPIINFPVNIPCTTTYDDTDYTFIYGDSYKVGFQGIRFLKSFVVGIVTGPGECDASDVICDGCHFTVPSMEISGTFYNCFFDVEGIIRTGSYYGEISNFYNCNISCGGLSEADVHAYGCDFHFNGGDYNTFGGGGSYFDCNIHMNKSGLDDSCDHMNIIFERCRFYGYDFDRYYGNYTECYKVSETKF